MMLHVRANMLCNVWSYDFNDMTLSTEKHRRQKLCQSLYDKFCIVLFYKDFVSIMETINKMYVNTDFTVSS